MGKVIITEFMSFDGVVESPEKWSLSFWNDETEKFKAEELAAHAAMLLGRVTYQGFAAAWPARTGEFADPFNALPKFVATSSLTALEWGASSKLDMPLRETVGALKSEIAGNIFVHGSISLSQSLLAEGLVDELHLLSYPILLGTGRKLFGEGPQIGLDLISAQALSNGVVALKYRVKRD